MFGRERKRPRRTHAAFSEADPAPDGLPGPPARAPAPARRPPRGRAARRRARPRLRGPPPADRRLARSTAATPSRSTSRARRRSPRCSPRSRPRARRSSSRPTSSRTTRRAARFADVLAGAARRGVAVRVLADAFGSSATHRSFWRELAERGIDVRLYHPLFPVPLVPALPRPPEDPRRGPARRVHGRDEHRRGVRLVRSARRRRRHDLARHPRAPRGSRRVGDGRRLPGGLGARRRHAVRDPAARPAAGRRARARRRVRSSSSTRRRGAGTRRRRPSSPPRSPPRASASGSRTRTSRPGATRSRSSRRAARRGVDVRLLLPGPERRAARAPRRARVVPPPPEARREDLRVRGLGPAREVLRRGRLRLDGRLDEHGLPVVPLQLPSATSSRSTRASPGRSRSASRRTSRDSARDHARGLGPPHAASQDRRRSSRECSLPCSDGGRGARYHRSMRRRLVLRRRRARPRRRARASAQNDHDGRGHGRPRFLPRRLPRGDVVARPRDRRDRERPLRPRREHDVFSEAARLPRAPDRPQDGPARDGRGQRRAAAIPGTAARRPRRASRPPPRSRSTGTAISSSRTRGTTSSAAWTAGPESSRRSRATGCRLHDRRDRRRPVPIGRPSGLIFDREGRLLIAEVLGSRIRTAGPRDRTGPRRSREWNDLVFRPGPALETGFAWPNSPRFDRAGALYFCGDAETTRSSGSTRRARRLRPSQGTASSERRGDGGPAAQAVLNQPSAIAIDGAGNVFIADTGNNVIRRVDAKTGIITHVAGTGEEGFSGDGRPGGDGRALKTRSASASTGRATST